MVAEVAMALQACSYDGSPLQVNPAQLALGVNASGKDVVAQIMRYTGLPQNFDVVEGQVPNAAAVIMLGPDKLPRRVIAYNPQFMSEVRAATANNDWAPISIMAHEIGHHLSGHTIMPGGSQPPTELEADKFSGFVLYKMGAMLADAQKAMNTLVPEQDGKTHPGRSKRVQAIQEGWTQACSQQSTDCSGEAVASTAPATPAAPATPPAADAKPATATIAAATPPVEAPMRTRAALPWTWRCTTSRVSSASASSRRAPEPGSRAASLSPRRPRSAPPRSFRGLPAATTSPASQRASVLRASSKLAAA